VCCPRLRGHAPSNRGTPDRHRRGVAAYEYEKADWEDCCVRWEEL